MSALSKHVRATPEAFARALIALALWSRGVSEDV